jgi:clan AA aspartic protease
MGIIQVTVNLSRPDVPGSYETLFLVDTRATDSMAPTKDLKESGFKPVGKMTYELATGQPVELEFGLADFSFMGEVTSGRIIFGPDDSAPILGVTILESVGIVVDPRNRQLKRLPAISLK